MFLCDEMDAGNANVLATLNALLSQPIAAFPDGMIPRHDAFVFIAAGNTTGAGADMKFVGRNQLDGATLDRFVFVFWEIDEDFELFVAGEDQQEWTRYVQKCRRAAAGLRDHRERRVRHASGLDQRCEGAAEGEALPPSGGAGTALGTPQRRGWREGEGQSLAELRRRVAMARRRFARPLGGMLVNREYPSFGAFVADAATGPDHGRGAASWAGCSTLGEAVDLARHGWPEGWQRMKALRDAIFARMASQVHRDQMQFRIAGGAVNVARFLSGRPDCFAARVRSNQVKDLRSRKVLRMVVNVGARGSVSADTFFARGAAAVTLIEALERAGVRVQVDMLSLATNGDREGGQDRLPPERGGRGHSARQAGVLPRSSGAAPEVELRPAPQARRLDRGLHRRAPRSTRRHLHRRGGLDRDGGVARSGEGASLGAGAVEGAGDHHAGRLAASGVQSLTGAARVSILIAVMGAGGCGGPEPMPPVPPPQSTAPWPIGK